MFSLVVDNFGIQYVGHEHAQHLIEALREMYEVTVNMEGTLYCGLTLLWDYTARTVQLSMPGYIALALHKFHHPPPTRPEHSPHPWIRPVFGTKGPQAPLPHDNSPPLNDKQINFVQQVVGTLLYYARAVDPTMLVALGTIAEQQSKATTNTVKALNQLLNYAATHNNAVIQYKASNMILHVDSDASYISLPEARSRAGGFFYLSDTIQHATSPPLNGTIHIISNKLRNVMASAAKAEIGALYKNCQEIMAI